MLTNEECCPRSMDKNALQGDKNVAVHVGHVMPW